MSCYPTVPTDWHRRMLDRAQREGLIPPIPRDRALVPYGLGQVPHGHWWMRHQLLAFAAALGLKLEKAP